MGKVPRYKMQVPIKLQKLNLKDQINFKFQMTKQTKKFDLEERSSKFAKEVVLFCRKLPRTQSNIEYTKQVIRSSASIGANYIEANESLGKKDFLMRIRISRKEAKETAYWLRLIINTNPESLSIEGQHLTREANELKSIFSSIIEKLK